MGKLEEKIFKRIATSSGPYHMFGGALVDAVVLMPNCTAVYFEEIPSKYLQEEFGNLPRMVWLFDYGDNDERERDEWELHPDVQYHQKAYLDGFLHPIFSFYGAGDTEPKYKAHMHADFFTRFNGAVAHHETMSQFLLQSMHDSFKSNPTCMALGGAKIVFGPKAGGCALACAQQRAPQEAKTTSKATMSPMKGTTTTRRKIPICEVFVRGPKQLLIYQQLNTAA